MPVALQVEPLYISASVLLIRTHRGIPGAGDALPELEGARRLLRKVHISGDIRRRTLRLRPACDHHSVLIKAVDRAVNRLCHRLAASRMELLAVLRAEVKPVAPSLRLALGRQGVRKRELSPAGFHRPALRIAVIHIIIYPSCLHLPAGIEVVVILPHSLPAAFSKRPIGSRIVPDRRSVAVRLDPGIGHCASVVIDIDLLPRAVRRPLRRRRGE